MTQHTPSRFRGFQGPNYTQVPDAVFDELLPDLTGAELKVLLYVIRRTFGFKRDSDHISLSQMLRGIRTRDGRELDRGVGLTKKTLLAAINSLEEKGIILTERRRSVDRGDEPTTYRLNVVDAPRGVETTPPVGEKVHHGGGEEIPPGPWGKNSPTQETVLQETVRQHTELSLEPDVNLSKFREGTPANFSADEAREHERPVPTHPSTGFASVASVLRDGLHPTGGEASGALQPRRTESAVRAPQPAPADISPIRQEVASLSPVSAPQPTRAARRSAAAAEPQSAAVERTLILTYIRDFAAEFHDQASVKSSVTRALHLLTKSGYPQERWSEKLYEARGLTRERAAAIGYQGDGQPRAGVASSGLVNKMPYYFELLACVLGLHDHPAGQHPLPLSRAEFKRQQGRGARAGRQSGKVPSSPQTTSAEQRSETERPSLAGRYAAVVHRAGD